MAKAIKVFSRRFQMNCKNDGIVVVFMDLYKIANDRSKILPDGYRFSWIAFDPEDHTARVLFDCHPPKGPHIHIDDDKTGFSFQWRSLEDAEALFFKHVKQRFGISMDNEE